MDKMKHTCMNTHRDHLWTNGHHHLMGWVELPHKLKGKTNILRTHQFEEQHVFVTNTQHSTVCFT